ncbi:MAG: DUF424 family protein [Candidatus Nanohaloarchaea archaeon]|nr:DUF424 family protein [Candidatus Nanohaloarchaea archaeon]
MMFQLKIHDTDKGKVVAACDSGMIGDIHEEDGVRLEVREDFYRGEEAGIDEVEEALKEYVTANLVGNELVDALRERGVVEEQEIGEVDGVKHVQLFRI